uniref:Uncharacterized protein n=1 Tax=Opuntia streptacantha TaxID=393608 RepID=A0A7C9D7R8_OPUST
MISQKAKDICTTCLVHKIVKQIPKLFYEQLQKRACTQNYVIYIKCSTKSQYEHGDQQTKYKERQGNWLRPYTTKVWKCMGKKGPILRQRRHPTTTTEVSVNFSMISPHSRTGISVSHSCRLRC